jgi:type IV pilus assembly protein PilB
MSSHGFVGDVLIRAGLVDAAGLARGVELQTRHAMTLGRALADLGLAEESAVASALATALHLEYLDGPLPDIDPAVTALLPAVFCQKRGVTPLSLLGNVLRIAVTNPVDYSVTQDAEFRTGKKTVAVVVTQTWLERLCKPRAGEGDRTATYDMLDTAKPAGEVENAPVDEYDLIDPRSTAKDVQLPPVVKLANLILSDAAKAGASDVHIEPHEGSLQVRQRVDGMLHDVLTIPRHLQDATLSRFKIMSGMDIAERRKPQDGRSRLRFEGRRIDLRVSTMPTHFGEKVVIRLLNTDRTVTPIDQLGFSAENLRLLKSFIVRPQGMILVTGPTGSGKTSTLYAVLGAIRSSTNNIITIEDPIEMQIAGVNQMQVNTRAGLTFASGLRSMLRQDPNVILVGEIRDQETADIAFGAAQTGHLLLSTLHTNSATATITRLFDLDVQPFLVASSLIGIIAQRLVRRPCQFCAAPYQPPPDIIERCGGAARLPADAHWVAGSGCEHCGHSGLKGRVAIHEVLAINEEVRELISRRADESAIKRVARRAGARTLLDDGIEKASQGLTTLEEVLRAVSLDDPTEGSGASESTRAAEAIAADEPAAASPSAVAAPVASAGPAPAPASLGRVLVVEDSPVITAVIRYFLELEGFEVMVAENGLLGLELAVRERPDVVVSDVNMPTMGGVALVKALRAEPRTADVRILMLTSETSVESETEGLAAGADDYIAKPVEPRRLAARVKALRARSRAAAH